jgi:hypothetical protein
MHAINTFNFHRMNAQHITNLDGGPLLASCTKQNSAHMLTCVGATEVKPGRLEANNDTDYSGHRWALLEDWKK